VATLAFDAQGQLLRYAATVLEEPHNNQLLTQIKDRPRMGAVEPSDRWQLGHRRRQRLRLSDQQLSVAGLLGRGDDRAAAARRADGLRLSGGRPFGL
jgi:hypothetical protein